MSSRSPNNNMLYASHLAAKKRATKDAEKRAKHIFSNLRSASQLALPYKETCTNVKDNGKKNKCHHGRDTPRS